VEALRNTDTKIYERHYTNSYWKFVSGVLCKFYTDTNGFTYNTSFTLDNNSNFYIEVEDEPSEDDIGKLGWFWDDDDEIGTGLCIIDRLDEIYEGRFYAVDAGSYYEHFRPLTPEEVEKYTGYKVVKEG
jgi:hypothetical protein